MSKENGKTYSNTNMEEAKKILLQQAKEKKCPVCGGERKRLDFMERMEESLARFIRENNLAKRESCLFCVKKHVGKALVLFRELESFDPEKTGKGKIKAFLNHLEIIGNLQAAADEAAQYPELYTLLLESERSYRYEGLAPDWENIVEMTARNEGVYI